MFTQESIKAWSALAHKAVNVVPADGTIPAGLAGTFIHLSLTAIPFKTLATVTGEAPNTVHTGAPIQAGVGRAVIDVSLTVVSTVPRLTFTHVAAIAVDAAAAMLAGALLAFIDILSATWSLPASGTLTDVRSVVRRRTTHSSILTRMGGAGNLLFFTVFSCEWWTTLAGVTVHSINTNALIQTGPRQTFIYILLTAQTSKSRLALTSVAVVSV